MKHGTWLAEAILATLAVATLGALFVLTIPDLWRDLRAHWRTTRQLALDHAPGRPSDVDPVMVAADQILTITCPWCISGRGECTCPAWVAEHTDCHGEWTTTLSLLTAEQVRILRELDKEFER